MRKPLDLAFKGNRDYVQGPDIYSGIVRALEAERLPFRLSIHRFAHRQCELVVPPPGTSAPPDAIAQFWTMGESGPLYGWVEEGQAEIIRRAPYDEEPIWSRCQRSGKELELTSIPPTGYAAIEVLVSLTKRLHLDALPPADVKWVFTQLDMARSLTLADLPRLRIRLDQALGSRFTKSSVFAGPERLGSIHFAGVQHT
jgi:hypothetical protein